MSEGTKTLDIGALAIRVTELERIVAILTRERDNRPFTASPAVVPQYPFIPVMPVAKPRINCGKCGIELTDVMGYCCPRNDCPCGLGGFSCVA